MTHMSLLRGIELARGGIHNYITKHPIVVSYEVTLSCNSNCHHCDLGGVIKDEKQITPEEYRDLTQRLKPLAAQISAGEPLLRRDIAAIVRAIKQAGVQYAMSAMMSFSAGRVSINGWTELFPSWQSLDFGILS